MLSTLQLVHSITTQGHMTSLQGLLVPSSGQNVENKKEKDLHLLQATGLTMYARFMMDES